MRPWLTVIMPTYNGERFLNQALASVAAQRDRSIEVVAVDDGSSDLTLHILRRWSRRLRLEVVERSHSGNWVSSTAIGMAVSRGKYLCWLHQDDAWREGRTVALRARLAAHPDAALVVHPCWYSGARGERIGYWRCRLPRGYGFLHFDVVARSLLVQCSIAACGTVFSAEAARAVGPPDAALRYHADWDYWLRLARLSRTLHHPTPLALFRIHAASQTIARADEADGRLAEARVILRRHLPYIGTCRDDTADVEAVASMSAELNHALNALVAGQGFGAVRLLRDAFALGPGGLMTLLRDSQLVERCLSRLHASAGLRSAVVAGLRRSLGRCLARRSAAKGGLVVPNYSLNTNYPGDAVAHFGLDCHGEVDRSRLPLSTSEPT